MRPALVFIVLTMSGCFLVSRPLSKMVTRLSGTSTGWYHVTPLITLDPEGAVLLPPAAALDQEDDRPYMERVLSTHQRQFTALDIGTQSACAKIIGADQPPPGTVYVLVHGIGGVGTEWVGVIPTLAQSAPAAMFMYKWFAYTERGEILRELVGGIERLAQCYPGNRIVMLGHSAGGVLGAFAASRLDMGTPPHPIDIITVASPLAGVGAIAEVSDTDDRTGFFNDLGSVRHGYAPAKPGVSVLHLRTSYPADPVMKPTRGGYSPNAISASVKGARVVDLPTTLNHSDSLLYVARQLALGRLP